MNAWLMPSAIIMVGNRSMSVSPRYTALENGCSSRSAKRINRFRTNTCRCTQNGINTPGSVWDGTSDEGIPGPPGAKVFGWNAFVRIANELIGLREVQDPHHQAAVRFTNRSEGRG